jgi:VCBS repeat-containing protein
VTYTATRSDVDAADTVTWSLTGTDAAAFTIDSNGQVRLNASANYEAKSSYSINVVATDAGGLADSRAVTVSVNNVNEAPVVTSGAAGGVAENAATSTVVYTAARTDVLHHRCVRTGASERLCQLRGQVQLQHQRDRHRCRWTERDSAGHDNDQQCK